MGLSWLPKLRVLLLGRWEMNVIVFGSTGGTGRLLVEQALEQGHSVTAFARDPNRLEIQHPRLQLFQGDVMDLSAVEQALQGQEAVVCILGAGQKLTGRIRSEGTRQIITAMEKTGVRRLICQSTLGAGESWGNLNLFWKTVMFGLLLRNVLADHERQEHLIMSSNLDWTIIRPGSFVEGERTGQYRYGFSGIDKTIQLKISRADVADFILNQLADRSSIHKTPSLSY